MTSVDHRQVVDIVARQAGVTHPDGERAVRATLQTLAERISRGQARHLAEQLPDELVPWSRTDHGGQCLGVDEFVRRVAAREDVDPGTAEDHVRATFAALRRAVSPDELGDVAAELWHDLRLRLAGVRIMPVEEFDRKVAARGGIDLDLARRAAEAVLETLAERIPSGEVDDLAARLPLELHPPLARGRASSPGAVRMPVEEFVARVAEREGVTPDEAVAHTRVVLAVLREAVGDEFFDVVVELPNDDDPLRPIPS